MTVVARFSVPAEQFSLGDAIGVREDQRVRLETMVPLGDDLVPNVWVDSGAAEDVAASLRAAPVARDVQVFEEVDGETLLRVAWDPDVDGILETMRELEAVVLEATGIGEDWRFRVRFPEHEALSAFYQRSTRDGMRVEVLEVNSPSEAASDDEFGLTAEQREALTLALEEGYFDVPRTVTLVELAEQLGVSDTAASQRIRRGLTSLVGSTVGRSDATRED